MLKPPAKLEKTIFRLLNAIVEPAVRKGFGSLTIAPASLIVLETTGFKSGQKRKTPLWSIGLGRYRLVSTARGDRSFWVKNLEKESQVSFYLGGRRRAANAWVVRDGQYSQDIDGLPRALQQLVTSLAQLEIAGWAFALLVPERR